MSQQRKTEKTKKANQELNKQVAARPFLKWVGGKRQLLSAFERYYPRELKQNKIQNYYEPFVGGGAVFFDIMQKYQVENAHIYDINEELILTYKVIQQNVETLMGFLEKYDEQYKKLNESDRKEYYYQMRENFNLQRFNIDYNNYATDWIPRAAQIIFLNKTCFNGLFRFNSKGAFNSPMGSYVNPKIIDRGNLLKASSVLQRTYIKRADFREMKNDIKENSFVYFDPPYRPISKTASFTSYSKYNFEEDEQLQLALLYDKLNKQGHKLMLSNSDPKNIDPEDNFFETIYSRYTIRRVNAKRAINSDARKRNAIKEILVTNY